MGPVTAVVPVKTLARAKTRLALPDRERGALALAFVRDTVAALAACPLVAEVLVVTSDPAVATLLPHPVHPVPDPGAGLGAAVHRGLRRARARHPRAGLLVVPADLPCLRPDEVTQVLEQARAAGAAFVPDRAATGTTMVVLPAGPATRLRYGPGSASLHRAAGLRPLDDAPLGARHDVDTVEDLAGARELGTGAATAAALDAMAAGRVLTPRWPTSP